MTSNDEKVRAAIAEQAGEWFVANDEGPLDARDSAALAAWLKTSPVHVEEFLGVSVIARDLQGGRAPILSTPSRRFSHAHGPRTTLRSNPSGRALIDAVQGTTLTPLAHRRRGDGGVRCVESWLALDVERQAHPAPVGTRRHHGTAL